MVRRTREGFGIPGRGEVVFCPISAWDGNDLSTGDKDSCGTQNLEISDQYQVILLIVTFFHHKYRLSLDGFSAG